LRDADVVCPGIGGMTTDCGFADDVVSRTTRTEATSKYPPNTMAVSFGSSGCETQEIAGAAPKVVDAAAAATATKRSIRGKEALRLKHETEWDPKLTPAQ
jgi:hypothetical protein